MIQTDGVGLRKTQIVNWKNTAETHACFWSVCDVDFVLNRLHFQILRLSIPDTPYYDL